MEWAWLIPLFCFVAAPLIVVMGPRLPGKGSFLAILAIGGGFVVFWVVLAGFLDAGPSTADCAINEHTKALTCTYEKEWFNAGLPGSDDSVRLTWGMIIDPLTIVMLMIFSDSGFASGL